MDGPADINSTPRIYLTYHSVKDSINEEWLPYMNLTVPNVKSPTQVLWLAGLDDWLTQGAKDKGIIDLVLEGQPEYYLYEEIEGDHHSMMEFVPDPLNAWYSDLPE